MGTARYSEEFKRDAATLVESSGWRISSLARERDVNPESLRQWIAQSRAAASPSGTGGECPLHQEEREELRRLCKEDALDTLRTLLFEFDSRSTIRDKEQLHRMLEKELWIFEDEYTHGVSEIGLTTALNRHLPRLDGRTVPQQRVQVHNGRGGRLDLLLSCVSGAGRTKQHLVVELKRPRTVCADPDGSR